ncbi:MAG TPA: hypothetical protein ENL34_10880 [Chloroflexi bacterium]|nr:hypothetical protein [Chloroflexota bacterium]
MAWPNESVHLVMGNRVICGADKRAHRPVKTTLLLDEIRCFRCRRIMESPLRLELPFGLKMALSDGARLAKCSMEELAVKLLTRGLE